MYHYSKKKYVFVSVVCGAVATLLAPSALAQNAANGGKDANASRLDDDDIVVTATRRAGKVKDVPLSIVAFTGKQLEDRKVDSLTDLALIAPGVTFQTALRNASGISIRGVTTASDATSVDPGVAVYIDDVPTISRGELREEFVDLDRVEVLRGPQGTLFGRNVTGGLIAIHTREPSFKPEAKFLLGYGNYNDVRAQAYVTGPLTDNLAAKLVVNYHRVDGYQDNVSTGKSYGRDSIFSARAQLLYKPASNVGILVGGGVFLDRGDPFSVSHLGVAQPTLPGYPALPYGFNQVTNPTVGKSRQNNYFGSVAVNVDFGGGTLNSITAYRETNPRDQNYPGLGLPAPVPALGLLLLDPVERNRQFSQELRFSSRPDRPFRFLGGLFYLSQDRSQVQTYTSSLGVATRSNVSNLNSYGLFGDVEYDLFKGLTLNVGARYTREDRNGVNKLTKAIILPPPFSPLLVSPFSGTFSAFTPKFSISYRPSDEVTFYGTISKGFKAGGFESTTTTCDASNQNCFTAPYAPETAWNYEGGVKTSLFDRRLNANITVFRQDYRNLQRSATALDCFCTRVFPLPKARIQGIESEVSVRPTDWLTLGGSWTYQDTEADFIDAAGVASKIPLPATPKNSVNLNALAHWPIAGFGKLSLGGDMTWRSEKTFALTTTPDPKYILDLTDVPGILNLQLTWTSENEKTRVQLWGRNVLNKKYLVVASDFTAIVRGSNTPGNLLYLPDGSISSVGWNPPATYGITLTYSIK